MTTFKNNVKYAELLLLYLDIANREECPIAVPDVLRMFPWRFKGGTLRAASAGTRLEPETSCDVYPDGFSDEIADQWPDGRQAQALRILLARRARSFRVRNRAYMARLSTFQLLASRFGQPHTHVQVETGMRAVYRLFGGIWGWCDTYRTDGGWDNLLAYVKEVVICGAAVSRLHVPTADDARKDFATMLEGSRVAGLYRAVIQTKALMASMNGAAARNIARSMGIAELKRWDELDEPLLSDPDRELQYLRESVGPYQFMVSQGVALLGGGPNRLAMGRSDVERLHQILMSAMSCLVGVCAQASVGTPDQKRVAKKAVGVAQANIGRIVASAMRVPLGEEVLVCKGYRRAYTAHLGRLAGKLCHDEYLGLVREAEETAPAGILDIEGFLQDARSLDAASSLNACKVFKICPAPDVSPGAAMMDRIKQIGNGNEMHPDFRAPFEVELRTQILRAYIRQKKGRLELRDQLAVPTWYAHYLRGEFDKVPSADIDQYLEWEGDAEMPDASAYDPKNWKDSGLGADDIQDSEIPQGLGMKGNMMTRLVFDDECPMPGRRVITDDRVIKFFTKSEGHKDPARGIFSSNLTDRQAQSWMERAVDRVARHHPSYMIGQEVDERNARVQQLTSPPEDYKWVPLYYSFDISGWSAKMPGEVQRISHKIWGDLYDESLFRRAYMLNEGAHIYLNIEGYVGWFKNTHANLEGFNGKEMTMVLVALLSLSVRRWRARIVEEKIMTEEEAGRVNALLFAYIDDGLSRIDLPKKIAVQAFTAYKETVIDTFANCGFSVEVTKCFPSDRFAIFLNEVYLAGRHVVHGVRAAMAISSEPTERHTTLIERVSSVSTGCRGATMAGLHPLAASILMGFHTYLHLLEWVIERDPVILAAWSYCPRTWGGLGLPNMMQLFTTGSGAAFEEGIATLQKYAKLNKSVRRLFVNLTKADLDERDPVSILTAPLSGKVLTGYMVDSRVAGLVKRALREKMDDGRISAYAERLLRYADEGSFKEYATIIVPLDSDEVMQEQMLVNMREAHPHTVFSAFARRLEKSSTLMNIAGKELFERVVKQNRDETLESMSYFVRRFMDRV